MPLECFIFKFSSAIQNHEVIYKPPPAPPVSKLEVTSCVVAALCIVCRRFLCMSYCPYHTEDRTHICLSCC